MCSNYSCIQIDSSVPHYQINTQLSYKPRKTPFTIEELHEFQKSCRVLFECKIAFPIDGDHYELRMDKLEDLCKKRSDLTQHLAVVKKMFPPELKSPNYVRTTTALIFSISGVSKAQWWHMDSSNKNQWMANTYFTFPYDWNRSRVPGTVVATVFKDLHIDNSLDLVACDSEDIKDAFMNWDDFRTIGPPVVKQGDTIEFKGHVVHRGPENESGRYKLLRALAFEVYQPKGQTEEHPPGEEYQVSECMVHLWKHPGLFYRSLTSRHRFFEDMLRHPPYEFLERCKVRAGLSLTEQQLLQVVAEEIEVKPEETGIECPVCKPKIFPRLQFGATFCA